MSAGDENGQGRPNVQCNQVGGIPWGLAWWGHGRRDHFSWGLLCPVVWACARPVPLRGGCLSGRRTRWWPECWRRSPIAVMWGFRGECGVLTGGVPIVGGESCFVLGNILEH